MNIKKKYIDRMIGVTFDTDKYGKVVAKEFKPINKNDEACVHCIFNFNNDECVSVACECDDRKDKKNVFFDMV